MKIVILILLFLIPTKGFAMNFKMSCSGTYQVGGDEGFIENYTVTDTNVINYETTLYSQVVRSTKRNNINFNVIKKDKDEIYAVPDVPVYNTDWIVINLEKNKIFFYKTKYSAPDLKNRVKETTEITKVGDCVRIN